MFLGESRWRAAVVCVAVANTFACHPVRPVPRKLDDSAVAKHLVEQVRKIVGPVLDPVTPPHYRRDGDRFVAELREDPIGTGRRARVLFPWLASGPLGLLDVDAGVSADVSLTGFESATASTSNGLVAYPEAKLVRHPHAAGVDDYLLLPQSAAAEATYDVALGRGVIGLRFVDGVVELIDHAGAPRLRLARPVVIGSRGGRFPVSVSVTGCAIDQSPTPPWGAPVTVPGATSCTIHLRWGELRASAHPAVLQARWSTTGAMSEARDEHRSASLNPHQVLVAGGFGEGQVALSSAEVFDATTGTWASTAPMNEPRAAFTLTELGQGTLLAVGGRAGSDVKSALASAERYEPKSGTWRKTAEPMTAPRVDHTATLLEDGRVLIAGGQDDHGSAQPSAVLYVPIIDRWLVALNMATPRRSHAAVRLSTGQVLVAGGQNEFGPIASAELFDPNNQSWMPAGSLSVRRADLAAALLRDGSVAFVGGQTDAWPSGAVDWYSPATGTWTAGAALVQPRTSPVVSVLGDGSIVLTGGSGDAPVESTEVGSISTRQWTAAGTLAMPRVKHTAAIVGDGRVLVIGGRTLDGPTRSAEVVSIPLTCTQASDCATGFCVDGYCCSSECNAGPCDRCDLPGQQGICGLAPDGEDGHPSCAPYTCNGTSAACVTSCADDSACLAGNFCLEGNCTAKLYDGLACLRNGECESGYCNAKFEGICAHRGDTSSPATAPPPPRPASAQVQVAMAPTPAPPRAPPSIGGNGAYCTSGDDCLSGFCVGGLCCESACTGACGQCDSPGLEGFCSPRPAGTAVPQCGILCDGADRDCPVMCRTSTDCESGKVCVDGECRATNPLGARCGDSKECESGYCVDGYCCESSCEGSCATCARPGAEGVCTFVVGAGAPGRPSCMTSGICGGSCNGTTGRCAYANPTTVCAPAFCEHGLAMAESKCDGNGRCSAGPQTMCTAGCLDDQCAPAGSNASGGCASAGAGIWALLAAACIRRRART